MSNPDSGTASLSLPKGGGSIRGMGEKFQPSAFDGTGSFSIPIATSPVLHASDQGYRQWRNLGGGKLDMPPILPTAGLSLATAVVSFGDTNGDGRVELVVQAGSLQGYFESSPSGEWERFRAFPPQPTVDRTDPNLRRTDLTGDGLADPQRVRRSAVWTKFNPAFNTRQSANGLQANPAIGTAAPDDWTIEFSPGGVPGSGRQDFRYSSRRYRAWRESVVLRWTRRDHR